MNLLLVYPCYYNNRISLFLPVSYPTYLITCRRTPSLAYLPALSLPCLPPFNFATTTFYPDRFNIYQAIRYLLMSAGDDPGECRPGDLKFPGGINMLHPFQTGKPDSLKFIKRQINIIKLI